MECTSAVYGRTDGQCHAIIRPFFQNGRIKSTRRRKRNLLKATKVIDPQRVDEEANGRYSTVIVPSKLGRSSPFLSILWGALDKAI